MPSHYGTESTTFQDLVKRMGESGRFFGADGVSLFAKEIGLEGKGLEGFMKFANIMPFDEDRIKEMLSSISKFGTERRGFIQKQFDVGAESARSGFGRGLESLRSTQLGQMMGARQQTGGFAGTGAQQRSLGILRQAGQRQLGGLQTGLSEQLARLTGARERGLAGVEEQVQSRIGQTQSLLGDYISRLTQFGSQFLSMDPTGDGDPPKDGSLIGDVNIPGKGLTASQEDRLAQSEGWPDAASKKRWMDSGGSMDTREQYGWRRPSGG